MELDVTKILSREEFAIVLKDLKRRAQRSENSFRNLIVFRLAACCGLRVSEIRGLNLADVNIGIRPAIRVRAEITKGRQGKRRGRIVPLWWDKGTFDDLAAWKAFRASQGAESGDPFICQSQRRVGQRMTRGGLASRWKTAIRALGPDRVAQLSIHKGRHTFISHALFVGRSIVEVRKAAGHASVNVTSRYAHLLERVNVPDLFDFGREEALPELPKRPRENPLGAV